MWIARFFIGSLLCCVLAGCGGGGEGAPAPSASPAPSPAPSLPPVVPLPTSHGHFVGTVKIGTEDYYADALLTVDGAARLYFGGPYSPTGLIQQTRPESSTQFVGTIEVHTDRASGSGVIIGQGCSGPHVNRFCTAAAHGELSVAIESDGIRGQIRVTTSLGEEIWLLRLASWNDYYVSRASPEYLAGQYAENLAEFALGADTIMSVDHAGRLFFQSPGSGCIGNGTSAPHLDGKFNVYDVVLTIASCKAPYAHLNGGFEGLATTTASGYWDYDSLLRTWLSKRDAAASAAAIMMSGRPM